GTFVVIARRRLLANYGKAFVAATAAFGVLAVAGFLIAQSVSLNPLELLWDPGQMLRLVVIYLVLIVPFFCAATALCLTFTRFSDASHRVYSYDILGAGAGSLAILGVLFVVAPTDALKFVGALGLAAAAVADLQLIERPRASSLALVVGAMVLPAIIPGK